MRKLTPKALAAVLAAALSAQTLCAQYVYNPEHRRPINRTVEDLRKAQLDNPATAPQHELYAKALRHLNEFADRLRDGGMFDRSKLDLAISDVQRIIDEVKLIGEDQEILRRDNNELRRLRQHPDDRYRFPR